jgi:hypothetical protein
MAIGNADYDALFSTTLKKYSPKLEDNFFHDQPLTHFLQKQDNIVKVSGGAKIVEPLLYAANSTAGSYAGYDNILTTPQEGITAAEYSWKQYATTIAINGIEEFKNSGESEVIDLLKSKIMQAEMTISENFETMFHLDGAGNGGKDWSGLNTYIVNDPTAAASPGGISQVDNTWWRNTTTDLNSAALTIGVMATLYNTISKGKDHPSYIETTQTLFEKYESLLQPGLRYSDPGTADAGFQNLLYKSAPVVYSPLIGAVNAGTMYFVNPKYLKLKVANDTWFKSTPFEKPHGQDARYAQILCYGELVCSNRARQGKITEAT